ncbi:MAG: proline dehydrogenase [Candidatus Acidiferrum sp.]|jgi:proline dehydrogenase
MKRNLNKVVWSAWEVVAKHASKAYIAGPQLTDAMSTCRRLFGLGFGGTICFWNVETDSPRKIADAYTSTLSFLAIEKMDCYLSIKLPPLNYDFALLSEVLEQARQKNTLVHFDSLQHETADRTFSLIAQAARSYPHLGCTLPGRWARSLPDADIAVDLGLHVRVVKGQWTDPHRVEIDPREGFLNVIGRLAGRASSVGVATHDPELARSALERLREAATPCSLELLYGLPMKPLLKIAAELDVPVRVYVPFGHGWLPYSLTQARRNLRVFWWVVRDLTIPLAFPQGVLYRGF